MNSRTLLVDFLQALSQLQDALAGPTGNHVYKAGCIQYFEFCFELAWKTIKRVAEGEGMTECASPKSALKAAFATGWIQEEDLWLDMLSSRNKMSHTYKAEEALAVFEKLQAYADALQHLADQLSRVVAQDSA